MNKVAFPLVGFLLVCGTLSSNGIASAQTWTPVAMSAASSSGGTFNSQPPYALGYPTTTAPSWRTHYTAMLPSIKGIRFRGDFKVFGSGTLTSNHMALFFSDQADYYGNEYGLVFYMKTGKLKLYQCGLCNTSSQLWTETEVYTYVQPGEYLTYSVTVNSDGSFTFKAQKPWSPYTTLATVNVAKANWLPNLYNASGLTTAVVWRHDEDGGSWVPSAFHLDSVEVRQ